MADLHVQHDRSMSSCSYIHRVATVRVTKSFFLLQTYISRLAETVQDFSIVTCFAFGQNKVCCALYIVYFYNTVVFRVNGLSVLLL